MTSSLAPRRRRPISWTSTPDLDENEIAELKQQTAAAAAAANASASATSSNDVKAEVSMALPRRRHTSAIPDVQVEETFTLKKPPRPPPTKEGAEDLTISRTDSLAERVRKMQLLKKQNSIEREIRSRQSSIEK